MTQKFPNLYKQLNSGQRQAVDAIDGPVLVIAGPGTGKTQLLALRIANILQQTDAQPSNILCLTFTDSAASNMRERLQSIIGKAAYDVTISTYHAFGSELIRRYPEYFSDNVDLQPANDLAIDAIFRSIQETLPYTNSLKHEVFLRDIKSLVSDGKRALLQPEDFKEIARANNIFIKQASLQCIKHLGSVTRIDKKSIAAFQNLAAATGLLVSDTMPPTTFTPLQQLWQASLDKAVAEAVQSGKTATITKWKNDWLVKDAEARFIAGGKEQNEKLLAAAAVYKLYDSNLAEQGLLDYDDMILRAVNGLRDNTELRYTLQEQYLYILLDEYQDTNAAQARIVELLTDSPAHEGRPNVLAVGDDDQAIYAFQGANYSHMLQFYSRYTNVMVVPLTENYRSHSDILHLAGGIAEQIQTRLHKNFPAVSKTITAANHLIKTAVVARYDFKSELAECAWIANVIKTKIAQGTSARDIAVLAPKHQYLQKLVPFLQQAGVAIHYDKREDVLSDPLVMELLDMSRLVIALADGVDGVASHLWPRILSMDFWKLPTSTIWQLSWQARDEKLTWTELLLMSAATRVIALFFIRLSQLSGEHSLEQMFDLLVGETAIDLREPDIELPYRSPLQAYYFGRTDQAMSTGFWQLLSNLTVLRSQLQNYKPQQPSLLLKDFLLFAAQNQAAGIRILNTNPYQESLDAVELMTAYKAKGREFNIVYVMGVNDEIWGNRARAMGSRLSLPPNLLHISYAGASEDERLRLLYVALTRAESELYLTSHTNSFSGKPTARLKFLDEQISDTLPAHTVSPLLPTANQVVIEMDQTVPTITDLTTHWQSNHFSAAAEPALQALLQPRLKSYQLSPTEFNTFLDATDDGPARFLNRYLLNFPSAPAFNLSYGNAIHQTLEWVHDQASSTKAIPELDATMHTYNRYLRLQRLSESQTLLLLDRGEIVMESYLSQKADRLFEDQLSEYSFRGEGVFIGEAHLTGKIDKLIIDRTNRTIIIVDYKTGKPHSRWTNDLRLQFYRNQLYFYKLLVENSQRFKGYRVIDAYLEYVEPDPTGAITELHLTFEEADIERLNNLIQKVWRHIMELNFPDVSNYNPDLAGATAFANDLLDDQI